MPALCTPARGDALHTGILLAPGGVMYCHRVCTATGSVVLCTPTGGDALYTGILLAPGGTHVICHRVCNAIGFEYTATWSSLLQDLYCCHMNEMSMNNYVVSSTYSTLKINCSGNTLLSKNHRHARKRHFNGTLALRKKP